VTSGILDTIDGALADYEAGGDAMRWVPEEERAGIPVSDGMSVDIDSADFAAACEALGRDMDRMAEGFQAMARAVQPILQAQVKAFSKMTHAVHKSLFPAQHRRCLTCHPGRKPKPLAVDGHEYQRRRRARRRRRHGR
jgi:hypothetical protein